MAHTKALSRARRGFHFAPFIELQQSLPSQIQAIPPFVDQLMRFVLKFRQSDESEIEIEMALREALVNAVVHGNGENSCKRVCVKCRCYIGGEVSLTIQDQGEGFDMRSVPDPTAPENLFSEHGRGIYLMQSLMDEVHFEERGTVIHMRKGPGGASSAARKNDARSSPLQNLQHNPT